MSEQRTRLRRWWLPYCVSLPTALSIPPAMDTTPLPTSLP